MILEYWVNIIYNLFKREEEAGCDTQKGEDL
jgi:hypothetical protein